MKGASHILVAVEPRLLRRFEKRFIKEEWQVSSAGSLKQVEHLLAQKSPDCLVLGGPRWHQEALRLLREIRGSGKLTPCLLLLGKATVRERILALRDGADDVLCPPLVTEEVVARIHSLLRRHRQASPWAHGVGDLVLDWRERRAWRAGQEVALTPKEFAILAYLVEHAGQVVTPEALASYVWRTSRPPRSLRRLVHVHMVGLRRKVDGGHPVPLIHTVRGKGFAIGPQGPPKPSGTEGRSLRACSYSQPAA
jgi:DNA-binding response OmpR family regulator